MVKSNHKYKEVYVMKQWVTSRPTRKSLRLNDHDGRGARGKMITQLRERRYGHGFSPLSKFYKAP